AVTWKSKTRRKLADWPSRWLVTKPTTVPGKWTNGNANVCSASAPISSFPITAIWNRCSTAYSLGEILMMKRLPKPLDLTKLRVYPLAERQSLTRVEDILIDPDSTPGPLGDSVIKTIRECARAIASARLRGASVMLIYGAHLIRNGAALTLERMMMRDWITHLATNGAGTIHDWEYAFLGRSTESVEENVAT